MHGRLLMMQRPPGCVEYRAQNAKCGAHIDSSTLTREPKVPETWENKTEARHWTRIEHDVHFLNFFNCGVAHRWAQEVCLFVSNVTFV